MKRIKLLSLLVTVGLLLSAFQMEAYAAAEPESGSYHSVSNESRLNWEEPSEGYDPIKLTGLRIQKQGDSYEMVMVLETL